MSLSNQKFAFLNATGQSAINTTNKTNLKLVLRVHTSKMIRQRGTIWQHHKNLTTLIVIIAK